MRARARAGVRVGVRVGVGVQIRVRVWVYTQEGGDVLLGIERRPLKQRLDDRLRDLIRVRVRLGEGWG